MANYPWFRFYSEALHDRKIAKVAQVAGSERMTIFGCWAAILSIASDSPRRGWLLVTLQERFTKQDIADEFGLPVGTTEKIIAAFLQYEMLGEENGVFFVVNWEKRQFDSDISTERVRKHRAKHKGNVSETPPDTDTDTDTEKKEPAPAAHSETTSTTTTAAAPYSDDATAESIYVRVTGTLGVPVSVKEKAIDAIRAIKAQTGDTDSTVIYLQKFWREWRARKYSPTNVGWLDWAMAGEAPTPRANGTGAPKTRTLTSPDGRTIEVRE